MSEMTLRQLQILQDLKKLRLPGMAEETRRLFEKSGSSCEKFEEQLGILIQKELTSRSQKKMERLLKEAALKIPGAVLNDSMKDPERGLDYNLLLELAEGEWIREGKNLIITGQTGTGKTYCACALAVAAIQKGMRVRYVKTSRLIEELQICEENNTLNEKLDSYHRYDLLILDDFGMMNLDFQKCRALFEILDSREGRRSIITVSQIPASEWYDLFENSTYADACLDRLIQPACRLNLKGDSRRRN